jgi:Uncharacterized protein conserved in bacteria
MSTRPATARYVAFLRAINVGGRTVKMDRLRAEFEALRFRDVTTFIASGNVLFAAPTSADPIALEDSIERRLKQALGYDVATFVRTPDELAALVRAEPWPDRHATATLWTGFVKSAVSAEVRDRLRALCSEVEDVDAHGREVYWLRRRLEMAALRTAAKIDKALGAPVTFRNVTTVRKLATLMAVSADA